MAEALAPGATIGIFGGGQLGRMTAVAARRFGYRIIGLDPDPDCPLAAVADDIIAAPYDDLDGARRLVQASDLLTLEFENISSEILTEIQSIAPLHPGATVLATCRHRLTEKTFLADNGIPVAPFARVASSEELRAAIARIGTPAILKTCEFGYDGKGQRRIDDAEAAEAAWAALDHTECVLEGLVPFAREVSVMVHRRADGERRSFPVFENEHANHILDVTRLPARLPAAVADRARTLAEAIAEAIGVIGSLCIEFFVVEADGDKPQLVVNELAPRPHNSGHVTMDACHVDQFEQHVRAIAGLPLGDTSPIAEGGAMANLLGDCWETGEPDWAAALSAGDSRIRLHLYGKAEARAGRKMGHLNMAGPTDTAVAAVRAARERLR